MVTIPVFSAHDTYLGLHDMDDSEVDSGLLVDDGGNLYVFVDSFDRNFPAVPEEFRKPGPAFVRNCAAILRLKLRQHSDAPAPDMASDLLSVSSAKRSSMRMWVHSQVQNAAFWNVENIFAELRDGVKPEDESLLRATITAMATEHNASLEMRPEAMSKRA